MPRADWAVAAPGHRATPPAAAAAARTVEHATVRVSLDGGRRTRECLPCDEDKMDLWSSAPGADCHPGLCRPATRGLAAVASGRDAGQGDRVTRGYSGNRPARGVLSATYDAGPRRLSWWIRTRNPYGVRHSTSATDAWFHTNLVVYL